MLIDVVAEKVFVSPWKIEPLSTCSPSTTISISEFPREAVMLISTPPVVGEVVASVDGVAEGSAEADADGVGVGKLGESLLTFVTTI